MKKIVVIGGGTGSYTVLRGLKRYPVEITAVVSMFDSGGSTGMLRDEFGMLPPGDVRRCLVALAEENGVNILRELFNYRFKEDSSLKGHSFGNLFLAALTETLGSEALAIKKASKVLNIKGRVLPVSLTNSHLYAALEDGTVVEGETNIDVPKHDGNLRIDRVYLEPDAFIFDETEDAIAQADMIVIGPGDLYTSVIPNLLVRGLPEAIRKSPAKKVYVCNVMTKWGETNGFKASDYARAALGYLGMDKFDYMVCSTTNASEALLSKYAAERSFPVECDRDAKLFADKVLADDLALGSDIIRHDPDKLAAAIVSLYENTYIGLGQHAFRRDEPVG